MIFIATVQSTPPLLIAGLGELITEKSGVLNLGVEGMMLVGAVFAFIVAFITDSFGWAPPPVLAPVLSWPPYSPC